MMLFPENSWQRWGVWLSRKCGRPDDLNAAATARFNLMSCKSSMPHIPLPAKHLSGRRLCACVLLIMAAAMALADAPVRAAAHRTAENYARMRENGVRIAERNWHAYSWKTSPNLRLAQMVAAHLRALR